MFLLSPVLVALPPGGRTGESGEESLQGGEIELGFERSAIARPMTHSSGSVSLLLSDIPESSESPSVNLSALVCSGDGGGASPRTEADAPAVSDDRSESGRTLTASGSGVTGLKCPSNRADGPIPIGDSCQKLATRGTASADLFPAVLTLNLQA